MAVDMGPRRDVPDLEDLSREQRIEAMVAWFFDNFEDPAELTPYESAEGGYQWIWGGPYNALEEIGDAFADFASDEEMQAAADEVESDGLHEWAPNHNRMIEVDEEDVEDVLPPLSERIAALRGQLDQLDEALVGLGQVAPQMGHNRPPEGMRLGLSDDDIREARDSVQDVRGELDKPDPLTNGDPAVLSRAEGRFRSLAIKVRQWAMAAGKLIAAGVAAQVGAELWDDPVALYHKLETIAGTLNHWSSFMQMLF
ncbi:hypothetical protein [Sphingomonas crocodyli]|uniref:Uncharacterized protein n=1 Tax=Sphingomonas crocodyli TaxID=1979270 RepID=A0A437M6Y9_9SPHN|nr:hypothetical protein [Sphingomonas crocodyli]RVT93419.1 hypothetical protein EOD43_05960 [Sphingomonas crocodyli]